MASASETFEDHLSCPVCFEIFRDPHELICRHTFCLQCIKQIQIGPSIECPECRHKTNQKEIKKDFKSQRLIDTLKRQQQESIKRRAISVSNDNQNIKCEMCNNESKPAKYRCEDCEQFMCMDCEVTHKGMKLCRNHTVKSIRDIFTSLQSILEKSIKDLKQEERNVLKHSERVDTNTQEIELQELTQMADVDSCIDNIIQEANKHRKQLKKEIQEINAGVLGNLASSKQVFSQSHEQIKAKINFLTEMSSSEDIAMLKEVIASIDSNIQREIQGIKSRYPVMQPNFKSPVVVNKAASWSPKSSVWISVVQQLKRDIQDLQKPVLVYTDLTKLEYKKEQNVAGFCNQYGLLIKNDEIWCGDDNGIKIYTKNSKLLETIQHKDISVIRSMTKCDNGSIIVGCDYNKGLHIFDPSGNYQSKIADGSFIGVGSFSDQVFAIKVGCGLLHIFKYNNNKFTKIKTQPLRFKITNCFVKIVVKSDKIFISNKHKLQIYNKDLQLLNTVGQEGSGPAGNFRELFVCGVDDGGNVIVTDYGNHRIQIYKEEGGWQILKLPNEIKYPLNVVVDPETKDIWITEHTKGNLVKLTLK